MTKDTVQVQAAEAQPAVPQNGQAPAAKTPPVASVRVNTATLSSAYCNMATVNSTRDEVVLNFGVNQDWDRQSPDLAITLLKRIILSPHGAKRFNDRMAQVISDYEKRHGQLNV